MESAAVSIEQVAKLLNRITPCVQDYARQHLGIICYTPENTDVIQTLIEAVGFRAIYGLSGPQQHTNIRLYPDNTYMRCIELFTTVHPNISTYEEVKRDFEKAMAYEATHGSGTEDAADAGGGEGCELAGD